MHGKVRRARFVMEFTQLIRMQNKFYWSIRKTRLNFLCRHEIKQKILKYVSNYNLIILTRPELFTQTVNYENVVQNNEEDNQPFFFDVLLVWMNSERTDLFTSCFMNI